MEETSDQAHISDDWPFELTLIGAIQIDDRLDPILFE
jgi:hypothetical protein